MARTRRHARKTRGSRKIKHTTRHHRLRRRHGRKSRKAGSLLNARDDLKGAKGAFGHATTLVRHGVGRLGSAVGNAARGVRSAL
jgi:hypothetical protein